MIENVIAAVVIARFPQFKINSADHGPTWSVVLFRDVRRTIGVSYWPAANRFYVRFIPKPAKSIRTVTTVLRYLVMRVQPRGQRRQHEHS